MHINYVYKYVYISLSKAKTNEIIHSNSVNCPSVYD